MNARGMLAAAVRVTRKELLIGLVCLSPLPLAVAWAWHAADDLGRGLAERLLGWAAWSDSGPAPVTLTPDLDGGAVTGDPVEEATKLRPGVTEIEPSAAPAQARRRATTTIQTPSVGGIRISAETVLQLANSGVRPTAVPVPAEGQRPAGLMLNGVGGLGVAMQDGDVLTVAGGRPVASESDVVGLVIAARGKEAPAIGGQFWRNGERWNLVVEQPYVREDGAVLRGRTQESSGRLRADNGSGMSARFGEHRADD